MATRVNFQLLMEYVTLRSVNFAVLVTQVFATLGEVLLKVSALVIGVSPTTAAPRFTAIMQCNFGKNSVSDIQSVVAILGRGEHKFGLADVAGVKVHRTLLGVFVLTSELDFQLIGIYLRRDDRFGGHQLLEGNELFLKVVSHRLLIVFRFHEIIDRALQRDGAMRLCQLIDAPAERFGVAADHCDDQQYRSMLCDVTQRTFLGDECDVGGREFRILKIRN